MRFEYQISADDYVSGQKLYCKLSRSRKQYEQSIMWIVVGACIIVVAWFHGTMNLAAVLLAILGIWWIYAGIIGLTMPSWYIRRSYSGSQLQGKKFRATVEPDVLEVEGEACSWRVRPQGANVRGEDKSIFVVYGANTIFMFGKKYLTESQQNELRSLMRITSH